MSRSININNSILYLCKGLILLVLLSIPLVVLSKDNSSDSLIYQMNKYNVKWTSQSANSSESMPLGGGDIGLNVWVENGDILFYMSRSGCFDENNQFLKLGRVRIRLEPNILLDKECEFSQELKLHEGYIHIKGSKGNNKVDVNLWVDVFNPVVNVDINSSHKVKAYCYYENWRTNDRLLSNMERNACFSYTGYPGKVITYTDSIKYQNNGVLWSHRNRDDKLLFDFCVDQQGLSSVKDQMVNTQKGLTFGGLMMGHNMIPMEKGSGKYVDTQYSSWGLRSKKASRKHNLKVVMHTRQVESAEEWENEIMAHKSLPSSKVQWQKTKQWWHKYWQRSHIFINAQANDHQDKGWQVGRNYQLFRYMLGCNAYGTYPTKFNGGLFTYDPIFVKQFAKPNHSTPDYRSWGGGSFTAQNQRLVYWPMLKSGDFDMMPPQFNFYKRALKNAELRSQVYWGHGSCCFTEQVENFGLPFAGGWGFKSGVRKRGEDVPFGEQTNPWVRHHYTNQLEFSFMILKYYQYTNGDISQYMPFIESSVNFFFEHYKYRNIKRTGKPFDKDGKLVIFPSTAAETYKNIKNPTDLCAALKAVIGGIIELPDSFVSSNQKKEWMEKLNRVPDLTYSQVKGHKIIVPGAELPKPINQEITELYPVFPFEIYGVGRPQLQTAIDTWKYGTFARNHISWHQDGIFCARLGLVEKAKEIAILKLEDAPRRFPAFWGPGHDYVPDHNWGGSGMIGLQDMLVQCNGDKVFVLPAWPEEWDVDFKLHIPGKLVVEGVYMDGEMIKKQISEPHNN